MMEPVTDAAPKTGSKCKQFLKISIFMKYILFLATFFAMDPALFNKGYSIVKGHK